MIQKGSFAIHGIYLCNMESIYSFNEIEGVAKNFIQHMNSYKVFAFHGNLGAGKTTFIQNICKLLEVKVNVSSPTFSIINRYSSTNNNIIYHIDLYRVKDDDEAINAGVEECIFSNELCFIEWPDRVTFLPAETVNVFIDTISLYERKLFCKLPG